MDKTQYLKDIKALLTYQRGCGIRHYRNGAALQQILKQLPDRAVMAAPRQSGAEQDRDDSGRSAAVAGRPAVSLAELTAEIATCRLCNLHLSRQIDTSGRGGQRPRLLIVGDWLLHDEGAIPPGGTIFGAAEDAMLARMIAAINLKPEDVFITNAIKCSIPCACEPTDEQMATCSGYLQSQIALLSPDIICTMGLFASRLLTGKALPLSQLRGRFSSYRSAAGREIPLLATYHPRFLLENPEMKQATWTDLQAIQKRLISS